MTVNNNTIQDSIDQLETLLFHDDILNETESHPLFILRDQLEQIDDKSVIMTIDEKEKLLSILNYSEINIFYYFINQYSSIIPSSILKALFDIIDCKININLKLNQSLSEHYFHFSLIYLTATSTIDYLMDKKEMITNIDEYFLHLFSSIGSRSIYTKTSFSYSICVSHKNIPTFFQLNPQTDSLLRAFIIYLNNYLLNNYQKYQSHNSILKWLVNLTEIYGFVPYFNKTGYPDAIVEWMTIKRDQTQHISVKSWFLIINLLYNLARHWTGVKALNKLKAIDVLKQWKDQYITELLSIEFNEHDKDILIVYYLVYSILLEPKELKKENMSNTQTVLDYILERTVQAFASPDLCCGPYNVCEYLSGLAKFFVNDIFLIYVISRDHIYELFLEKFLLFSTIWESTDLNTIICSSLYSIFWSISFQSEYNTKLKSNDKFISFIDQTAKIESKDEYAVTMRRAAKGILFNLDRMQMDIQPIEDLNNDNHIKVMISYAHKDTTLCKKLLTNLQSRFQDDIWVDFNQLSPPYEDDWEEIAKAITQCDIIIMIVTENYCSSKSCRREVIHADKRNKRMIPVYQGKDYKPEDWFEIRVGSATFVRFGGKKSDEEVMEILFGLIHIPKKVQQNKQDSQTGNSNNEHQQIHTIKNIVTANPMIEIPNIQLPSNLTVPNVQSVSTIEQWTSEEVQQWLRLPPSILHLSSGRALLTYINLLSNEDAQHDEYEQRMHNHGISREQFANLISSFTSLRALRNIETVSTKLPDEWTREEIKYWFQENHLSDYLLNTLNFHDGSELITYAKLIVNSPSRIDEEYERLRNIIGKDLFHLDEHARLLNSLKKLLNRSHTKDELGSCIIL